MKLLFVEDNKSLSTIISKGLRKCSYAVDSAYDGEEALDLFTVNEYDLIILDLNLPKIDGLDVLQQIRGNNKSIKIIILSARTEIEDRVKGLDMGANDYLIKPFDFKELEARISCLLRRKYVQEDTVLEYKDIKVNTKGKNVLVGSHTLNLTKKEYAILEYLLINKGNAITAECLIEHIWESDVDLFSNSLKSHIYSLKKKLAEYVEYDIVTSIRGIGYIIEEKETF